KFLDKKDIEVVEELEAKKREFFAMGRINTDIGKMEVLIIGKDKKKITQDDLLLLQQKSQSEGKVVILISTGEIDNKAIDYFNKYRNLIKFLKM
ncbi:MAG: hypothetical protein Q7R52_01140, partial [archaeon]|nr:hypothetical protein [Nanoarchaeota archaeon]MDO8622825.1 hypothetical protein [archaeon]